MNTSSDLTETEGMLLDFVVGHHKTGGWFVVETHGLAGGLFRSELEAFKFLAGDFQTRAKHIEVVREVLDPFDATCVEIARRCRDARHVAVSP